MACIGPSIAEPKMEEAAEVSDATTISLQPKKRTKVEVAEECRTAFSERTPGPKKSLRRDLLPRLNFGRSFSVLALVVHPLYCLHR